VEGGGPTVTEQDIAGIVCQWTGIPIEKVGGWVGPAGVVITGPAGGVTQCCRAGACATTWAGLLWQKE
jgi:hypothetical protein